jgi:hypothetical protein
LSKYNIIYCDVKNVKESTNVDHLADNVIEEYGHLSFDFQYEDVLTIEKEEGNEWWTIYCDGAVNIYGNGVEAIIIFLDDKQYPISFKLEFGCTNNITEYKSCIHGLETIVKIKIKLNVYGDSV